jgi:hypothetical protein
MRLSLSIAPLECGGVRYVGIKKRVKTPILATEWGFEIRCAFTHYSLRLLITLVSVSFSSGFTSLLLLELLELSSKLVLLLLLFST